ncbi:MAG: hypothetical protein FJX22_02195, partial [Alphaproteobacteria bacterium]|nr:hypothetical protein [Alphaproteobacteria bacterium]
SLVLYEPPLLRLHMPNQPAPSWWQELEKALRQVVAADWLVQSADAPGGLSLMEQAEAEWATLHAQVADHPAVKELQQGFADFAITAIHPVTGT